MAPDQRRQGRVATAERSTPLPHRSRPEPGPRGDRPRPARGSARPRRFRVQRKHQNPWGQSSRHRRLNVQTSPRSPDTPFRRRAVSPFDPTDFGASYYALALLRGSSPRGRGTHRRRHLRGGVDRFIPARAGNTHAAQSRASSSPVHPRAGGEHPRRLRVTIRAVGSSPRGRGTLGLPDPGRTPHRFIPARAGNTRSNSGRRVCSAVHPRAGGEHNSLKRRVPSPYGSSPRGRGTLEGARDCRIPVRFIPARAGNTHAAQSSR